MTRQNLNLKELAAATGAVLAGAAGVEPAPYLRERLERRLAERRVTPFEERELARRLAPERLLPGCRSIVVVGMPYEGCGQTPPPRTGELRGAVARCARGLDYHLLLENKAEQLAGLIKKELAAPVSCRILSDRSPLVERDLAYQAGLGWIGQNCALFIPGLGSHAALGTILLDRPLEPGAPLPSGCLGCGRCREACPTGALAEPFVLDPRRCLSYLTQAPGTVPAALRPLLGTRLYGCDLCQEACPRNRELIETPPPASGFAFFPAEPLLLPLLEMTRQEFARTIGLTAAGWRGKTILQRNAAIALGNCGDTAAVPALARVLKSDPRPLLRLHAAWALGRIGGGKARRHLEASFKQEPDRSVKEEARLALSGEG